MAIESKQKKQQTPQQIRWARNQRIHRERSAPPEPSQAFVANARAEAERRVRAAMMPAMETFLEQAADAFRKAGKPFQAADLFSIWYDFRNDPRRPNLDIWRMSDMARDLTIEVWAARTLIESQRGAGKAKAGRIATWLHARDYGHSYAPGSLRVVVDRALDRIRRIEAESQLLECASVSGRTSEAASASASS